MSRIIINHNYSKFYTRCIQICFAGFSIIAVVIISLVPIYIKDQSVGISNQSLPVYMIYNLIYNVTMFSISTSRVISPNSAASVFTSTTIESIKNQLDKDFATIGATCIITGYTFDTSELILNLKVTFYRSCQNCEQLIKNVRKRLEQLKVTGQCYQDCSLSPRDCSFFATPDKSQTAFDVLPGTNNNQGSVGNLCLIPTQTATGGSMTTPFRG